MERKELYRDFIAIASPLMFILVFLRSAIEPFRPFMDQVFFSGIILLIFYFLVKHDGYTARVIPLAFFTSNFYMDLYFTIFVSIISLGVVFSSYKLNDKKKVIIGLVFGLIATSLAYFLSTLTY